MRVLFVCLGNICRSPLAEVVFLDHVQKAGLESAIRADSAGTAGYHVGERADQRSLQVARQHGLEITHRARQVVVDDFRQFDLILGMDHGNVQQLKQLASCDEERAKVHLFRRWDSSGVGAIPDPYYGTMEDFEGVYRLCYQASQGLMEALSQNALLRG